MLLMLRVVVVKFTHPIAVGTFLSIMSADTVFHSSMCNISTFYISRLKQGSFVHIVWGMFNTDYTITII